MKTLEERFWDKVEKTDGCWKWNGSTHEFGYGTLSFTKKNGSKKPAKAHRISWGIHNGPIPDGLCVLHKCDNPPCTNPEHLFLGTIKDNHDDMTMKGRRVINGHLAFGENNGNSSLTSDQVKEIREMSRNGFNQGSILAKFNVSRSTISRIVNLHTWKPKST